MAVGAGSIKRAAKAKVESAENKVVDKVAEGKEVEVKAADNKVTGKGKTSAKKTVTKKTTSVKKAIVKPQQVEEKVPEVMVAKKEINQVCHLTEDLPIHLL